MGLLSIGKFAKASGLSVSTLRRLHATGELVPCHITDSGTRYYSQDQLDSLTTPERATRMGDKPAVGYCRVSTRAQKDDLETQVSNVEAYMAARGCHSSPPRLVALHGSAMIVCVTSVSDRTVIFGHCGQGYDRIASGPYR